MVDYHHRRASQTDFCSRGWSRSIGRIDYPLGILIPLGGVETVALACGERGTEARESVSRGGMENEVKYLGLAWTLRASDQRKCTQRKDTKLVKGAKYLDGAYSMRGALFFRYCRQSLPMHAVSTPRKVRKTIGRRTLPPTLVCLLCRVFLSGDRAHRAVPADSTW